MMSQVTSTVTASKNGSIIAGYGAGRKIISEASIPFQSAIDEPSYIVLSSVTSSSTLCAGKVMCCSLPRVSVKRKSTHLALDDSIRSSNLFDMESFLYGYRGNKIETWNENFRRKVFLKVIFCLKRS